MPCTNEPDTILVHTPDTASDSAQAGRHSVALFFDMEKAFDTISKDRLHVKLESLGVPLRFRYWIRN